MSRKGQQQLQGLSSSKNAFSLAEAIDAFAANCRLRSNKTVSTSDIYKVAHSRLGAPSLRRADPLGGRNGLDEADVQEIAAYLRESEGLLNAIIARAEAEVQLRRSQDQEEENAWRRRDGAPSIEEEKEGLRGAWLRDKSKQFVHPGRLLNNLIGDTPIAQIAVDLGVAKQTIYRLINGDINLTARVAKALEDNGIGPSALEWLAIQNRFDLAQLDSSPPRSQRLTRTREPYRSP